jgi:hypothetical protein
MIDALLVCDRCSMIYRCQSLALRAAITQRCICGAELRFDKRRTLRALLDVVPESRRARSAVARSADRNRRVARS